ncbi:MAG: adenylate/guanylate cyclase domain-containing protein [Porticoccaceae bacterium]
MKQLISAWADDNPVIPEPIGQGVDSLFRVSATAIVIATVSFQNQFPSYWQLALSASLLFAAIYFVIAYLAGYSRPGETIKTSQQHIFASVDVVILGIVLMLVPFSVTAFIAVLLLTGLRAVAFGGLARLFVHGALLGATILCTYTLRQPQITIQPTETVSFAVLLCTPLFICYLGLKLFNRQRQLSADLQQATIDKLQLKLNNYKLAKYLSPSLRKAILSGKRVSLETQRKKLTVFFSDIKGFSELSEQLETESLTEMLNLYLTEMSHIALKFGGTIDKFIGDAIMVFFGDPVSQGAKEDCIACVSMAIAMQKRMKDLNLRWQAQGINTTLEIRMGINTGFCTVGNFGTESRLDYTLLGTEVNKASRLESSAESGEILVSATTHELIKDVIYCEPKGFMRLKGFKQPIETFKAVDLRANLGREAFCVDKATDGFTIYMDVDTIPHMQKQQVMASLEEAYEQLRRDIERNTRPDIKIIK